MPPDRISFDNKCRVFGAVRKQGWSPERTAIVLAISIEQVYDALADEKFAGPLLTIND